MLLETKKTKKQTAIEIFSRHFVKLQSGFYKEIDPRRPYFLFRTAILNELMETVETSKSGASCLFNDIKKEVINQYPETEKWLTRDPNITSVNREGKLASKLDKIAMGEVYHEGTLREASQYKFLSTDQKSCLERWLNGEPNSTDHIQLQEIANLIRNRKETV